MAKHSATAQFSSKLQVKSLLAHFIDSLMNSGVVEVASHSVPKFIDLRCIR